MPLLILLLSILASARAMSYFSMDQLPNVLPIDKIPAIKEFNDPQFLATAYADASLTIVSAVIEIESKLKKKRICADINSID